MAPASLARSAEHGQSALIVAHPGHELCVFRWMEEFQPLYCCITEGSGGTGMSRIASTTALLDSVGAARGPIFGRYRDKEVYQLLLDGTVDVFADMATELADFLMEAGVAQVAGDAVEGFNPVHDVCRFVIDGAVDIVRSRTGHVLRNHDFVLDGQPDACPEAMRSEATRLDLDQAALDRKIAAALAYPELREEVSLALKRFGRNAFAVEYLRPSMTHVMIRRFDHERPAYETYGKTRVDEHQYDEIIRYREHVLPVRQAIQEANRR
jgi:hypothetical protein